MTFARPEFLALLATVPIGAFFVGLAAVRRRRLARRSPLPRGTRIWRGLGACLFLAGLTLLALAAAGPQTGATSPGSEASGPLRLVIALDCSRSMLARDVLPDRLQAAKAFLLDVLARLPGVEAGLVGFAGRAWLACPVTADRAGWALFLEELSPAAAPLGGTNLASAVEASRLALAGSQAGRVEAIVLVSDGEETAAVPDAGARRTEDAPVFTVAVGGPTPVPVPVSGSPGGVLREASGAPVLVGVDPAGLAALAAANAGRAFRLAPGADSPAAALAGALRGLAAAKDRGAAVLPATDLTARLLGVGIGLLLAELFLATVGPGAMLVWAVLAVAVATPALAASRAGEGVDKGMAAYANGDFPAAREAFWAAQVWAPQRPEIFYDIGVAEYRLGRFAAAREAFARAGQARDPKLRAKALYNQGNAAFRLGDVPEAMRLYETTLGLNPQDADARANLDWLRSRDKSATSKTDQSPSKDTAGADKKNDPSAGGEGQQDKPGQAPSPQGTEDGHGGQGRPDDTPVSAPAAGKDNRSGQAVAPVPAKQGEKAGDKMARTAGAADDPILDRVPDLPGLPASPSYGRPQVEKDW